MDLLENFKIHLENKGLLKVSIKNYISDIGKFIRWYEESYRRSFNPILIKNKDIYDFKQQLVDCIPQSSLYRYISSLKAFFSYLFELGLIPIDIFQQQIQNDSDTWHLPEFKDYLYLYGAAPLTIKNYIYDILYYKSWYEAYYQKSSESRSSSSLSLETIAMYKDYLQQEVPGTLNRRLSSIRRYITFRIDQGYIQESLQPQMKHYWQLDMSGDNLFRKVNQSRSYIYQFAAIFTVGFISSFLLKNTHSFQIPFNHNKNTHLSAIPQTNIFSDSNLNPSSYNKLWNDLQRLKTSDVYTLSLMLEKKDPEKEFHKQVSQNQIKLLISSDFVGLNPYMSSSYIVLEDKITKSIVKRVQGIGNEAEVMYTTVANNPLSRSLETQNACVLFGCKEVISYLSIYKPIFNLPSYGEKNTSLYITREEDTYRLLLQILSEGDNKSVKIAVTKPINATLPIHLIVVQ